MQLEMMKGRITADEIKAVIRLGIGRIAGGTAHEHQIKDMVLEPVWDQSGNKLAAVSFSATLSKPENETNQRKVSDAKAK